MFKLDDNFMKEIGLPEMHGEYRRDFLLRFRKTLEDRVGQEMTKSMSDEMLDEFSIFVNKDVPKMCDWLNANCPLNDPKNLKAITRIRESIGSDAPEGNLLSEFGAIQWLCLNRPDYPKIVEQEFNGLKAEVKATVEAQRV